MQERKVNVLVKGPLMVKCGYQSHMLNAVESLSLVPWIQLGCEPTNWGSLSWENFDSFRYPTFMQLIQSGERMKQTRDIDVFMWFTIPPEMEPQGILNILCTAGLECDRTPPEYMDGCNKSDITIVPSVHAYNSLAKVVYDLQDKRTGQTQQKRVQVPVKIIPEFRHREFYSLKYLKEHGKEEMEKIAELTKTNKKTHVVREFLDSIDTEFNFLINGLWSEPGEDADRKNIHTAIKLFLEAFIGQRDVGLIAKISCGPTTAWDFLETKKRIEYIKSEVALKHGTPISTLPPVYLLHGYLSDYDLHQLYFSDKVKVFYHLGREGYGLPILESAMAGCPIIAMNWSGYIDFLQDKFIKIPHKMDKVPPSACKYGIREDFEWAYPDKDETKRMLRRIKEKYILPKEQAIKLAMSDELNKLNIEEIGNQYAELIAPMYELKNMNSFGLTSRGMLTIINDVIELKKDGSKVMMVCLPGAAGDIVMMTHLLKKLRDKFKDHKLMFATSPQYFNIIENCPYIDKVVQYHPDFDNTQLTKGILDKVFSPHFACQLLISNPLSKEQNIVEIYANYLGVDASEYPDYCWTPTLKEPVPEKEK